MAEGSTQPPNATRFVETTRGILSYAQLAPLPAERVLRVQEDLEDSDFADSPLDEYLLQDLHRRICGDLIPEWAGRFRLIEVQVGQHTPTSPHRVPAEIRDYCADLAVRMGGVSSDPASGGTGTVESRRNSTLSFSLALGRPAGLGTPDRVLEEPFGECMTSRPASPPGSTLACTSSPVSSARQMDYDWQRPPA